MPDGATADADPLRWRILLVDDSADDAELATIELLDAGIDAECRHVEDEPQLLAALHAFAPHLVLSDLNMPGFSGHRAIELVRLHAPTARFAFVAGAIDHAEPALHFEPAAEAVLLKHELAGLPALVRRLLG